MEKIPAKDRFSQHENSLTTPQTLLCEALRKFGMDPVQCKLTKLSGGFMNANYLAADKSRKLNIVLRIYSTDAYTAQKEFDLLRFLESKLISVPKVYANFEVEGRAVVVMEYLDGITLEDKILRDDPMDNMLYEKIGSELGKIHNICFENTGFIGPKLQIGSEFSNFSLYVGQFIENTLRSLETKQNRLNLKSNKRLQNLIRDKWKDVLETEPRKQLIHCDFNPKNILVSKDQNPNLVGILDWEFACSGNGLIDLGNFFRFFDDYPTGAEEHFIEGYCAVNPNLPTNWEDAAKLLDLGNMCSFLDRKEDYQKTFRTARAVIKSTLEYYGY